jgi:hypothetical protein
MLRRSRPLSVSPLGVATIFLVGCVAGSAIQALSGGSLPPGPVVALDAPPPQPKAPSYAVAKAQPLNHKRVRTFAIRGGGAAPDQHFSQDGALTPRS